jgi:hypothetical protein
MALSRRSFLNTAPLIVAPAFALGRSYAAQLTSSPVAQLPSSPAAQLPSSPVPNSFPAHPPDLAREIVGVSHNNLARVKELLARNPTLSRAAWDWGFGDWEDALGAASHVGRPDIAETLLAHGARPSIFSAAMLGQLDVVKAFIAAAPGIEATPGPHGITLLRHALAGGERAKAVSDYLKTLPGADARPESKPITPEEMARLTGEYVYGSAADERITIAVQNDVLWMTRGSGTRRGLTHVGDLEFFPVGAPRARVRFRETIGAVTLTVHDPGLILEAKRTR